MPEKKERWVAQLVIPEGTYSGADDLLAELTDLIELNSEIEVIAVEMHEDQEMP